MAVRVRVRIDQAAVRRYLSANGEVGREVRRVTGRVLNLARQKAPVDTGRLRASHRMQIVERGQRVTGVVYTNMAYAPIVHQGRGPVEARNARALRFTIRGVGVVYARRVGPAAGQPWLWEALREGSPWPARRSG